MKNVRSICIWYDTRFDRRLVPEQVAHLLYEECHEFDASTEPHEQLDALADIIFVAIGAMWKMGLDEDQIDTAVQAICRSNHTKSPARIEPNQKYSSEGKGEHYVPPTEELLKILEEVKGG